MMIPDSVTAKSIRKATIQRASSLESSCHSDEYNHGNEDGIDVNQGSIVRPSLLTSCYGIIKTIGNLAVLLIFLALIAHSISWDDTSILLSSSPSSLWSPQSSYYNNQHPIDVRGQHPHEFTKLTEEETMMLHFSNDAAQESNGGSTTIWKVHEYKKAHNPPPASPPSYSSNTLDSSTKIAKNNQRKLQKRQHEHRQKRRKLKKLQEKGIHKKKDRQLKSGFIQRKDEKHSSSSKGKGMSMMSSSSSSSSGISKGTSAPLACIPLPQQGTIPPYEPKHGYISSSSSSSKGKGKMSSSSMMRSMMSKQKRKMRRSMMSDKRRKSRKNNRKRRPKRENDYWLRHLSVEEPGGQDMKDELLAAVEEDENEEYGRMLNARLPDKSLFYNRDRYIFLPRHKIMSKSTDTGRGEVTKKEQDHEVFLTRGSSRSSMGRMKPKSSMGKSPEETTKKEPEVDKFLSPSSSHHSSMGMGMDMGMGKMKSGSGSKGKKSMTMSSNIKSTATPTFFCSESPSAAPSAQPTISVAPSVSVQPSSTPSISPSNFPSLSPSDVPSDLPSFTPSDVPSKLPSFQPSDMPSKFPSMVPSDVPSFTPSDVPSDMPSETPSDVPSMTPSDTPSDLPSFTPSEVPSDVPSETPSDVPSMTPSDTPSDLPSFTPSDVPSSLPSDTPSDTPSLFPSDAPSDTPTASPSRRPSSSPSFQPTLAPSVSAMPSSSEPATFGLGVSERSTCRTDGRCIYSDSGGEGVPPFVDLIDYPAGTFCTFTISKRATLSSPRFDVAEGDSLRIGNTVFTGRPILNPDGTRTNFGPSNFPVERNTEIVFTANSDTNVGRGFIICIDTA